jgi:ComF family protein
MTHQEGEMLRRITKTAACAVLDLIYPPALYCVCCGKIIDETRTYRLCNDCMDNIKWIDGRTCMKCGRQLGTSNPGTVCFNCREHPHSFDRGFTCTEYGTHERAMVFAMKYDGRPDISVVIGEMLADRMLAEFGEDELHGMYDMILPVPVHPTKKSLRGYNQAALIAEEFSRRTGFTADDDVLIRTRETHIMRSLGPEQRRENIRGAFSIRPRRLPEIAGKSILLIDDIYTTGATIDELAVVLRDEGAACVDFLTFASGADMVKS